MVSTIYHRTGSSARPNSPFFNSLIEPGVPHEVFNVSDTEPVVAVVARSDAGEWENIVDYDRATGETRPKRRNG